MAAKLRKSGYCKTSRRDFLVAEQASELSYPVRLAALPKYGGRMCLVIDVLMLMPLVVSAGCKEFSAAGRYVIVNAIMAGGGYG